MRSTFNLLPVAVKGTTEFKDAQFQVNPPDSLKMQEGVVVIAIGDVNDIRRARHEAQQHGAQTGSA